MSEFAILPEDTTNETARVLRTVSAGCIVAGAVIAPNILTLLSKQLKAQDRDEAKTIRAVRYAKSRGWLTLRDTNVGVEVALTATGTVKWQKLELEQPLHARTWDKLWRVVMFDVPVASKGKAEVFRNHLKRLGFQQLQKSVWITPFPCNTQVAALRQLYDIPYHVRLLEVTAIDNESELKQKFHLN